jgi:hypothetical protein
MLRGAVRRHSWGTHAAALAAYAAVSIIFSWPLPRQLGTHLTGTIGGDTGVYVWNQWVFRHELVSHHRFPYFTDAILAAGGGTNLSLHNYTVFQNLLALPLMGWLGVVATFNVVHLAMIVLTAYATFLLARHVAGRVPEAWLAGLIFAWSPLLVTRGTAHFSLVAAAPVAVFLLVLVRAAGHERTRDAAILGAVIWWAALTDVYYAVYCLLIGGVFLLARVLVIERRASTGRGRAALWGVNVMLYCIGALIVALVMSGGWEFTLLGQRTRVRSLYTPVLAFTALALVRIGWRYRLSVSSVRGADLAWAVRLVTTAGVVATALLSPVLYAAAVRLTSSTFDPPKIFWRSSPPGLDMAAFLLPNPNHPLSPPSVAEWLSRQPNGYTENVASIPFVVLGLLFAAWMRGWRGSRWWLGSTAFFGLLALGPFVHVAGVNTYVPGPWALLRYAPVIGLARSPTRFSVVMMLGCAVLFAMALTWLGERHPRRRAALLSLIGVLLAAELLPAPVPLYSAAVPSIYRRVAEAPPDARLLELPFGLRDGTSSVGNFTARSQFYQTAHGKSLIGGYLSRLAWGRLPELRSHAVLQPLVLLSEGAPLSPELESRALEAAPRFVREQRIAYVVVDRDRTPHVLAAFARRAFRLEHVESDGPLDLYRPAVQ